MKAKEQKTKHIQGCRRVFKLYDAECDRCRELMAGSPPKPGWWIPFKVKEFDWQSHPKDHELRLNPGGYCITCGWGRDFS